MPQASFSTSRAITAAAPAAPSPIGMPLALVRMENLLIAAAALLAFWWTGGSWLLFAALFLAPDLSMLGYLAGPSQGARLYNLVHTYAGPALVAAAGWLTGEGLWLQVALIWCAHIGVDRTLGFGLKYESGFADTHLGRLKQKAAPNR